MIAVFEFDGRRHQLHIPFTTDEIRFGEFCDFQVAERKFLDAAKAEQGVTEQSVKGSRVAAYLCEAMEFICGSAIYHLPFSRPGDNLTKMMGRYVVNLDDDLSVMRLYCHVVTVMRAEKYTRQNLPDHVPQFINITHKGKKYTVQPARAARIISDNALSTGEALEVLEYRRRHAEAIKAVGVETSVLDFTLGLSEFAILVRRKGERLPADDDERERFIAERRELLKDLPMSAVCRVRFFLIAALAAYVKKSNTGSFLKDRQASKVRRLAKKRGRR